MKKSAIALALALTMLGTLAACGTDRNAGDNNTTNGGTNSSNSTNAAGTSGTNPAGSVTGGTTAGGAGSNSSGVSAGQVARQYDNATIYNGRTYWDDGRYTAGSDGQVYDYDNNTVSRDLTNGARDIVRGTENVMDDIGRGIGDAARDISGTPSWEPDSSAVRQ